MIFIHQLSNRGGKWESLRPYAILFANISYCSAFEHGSMQDPTYFYKRKINSGDRVYVASADLPEFILNYFSKLAHTVKITLVTGCEDIGVPYEIFHPNRPYLVSHTDIHACLHKLVQTFFHV